MNELGRGEVRVDREGNRERKEVWCGYINLIEPFEYVFFPPCMYVHMTVAHSQTFGISLSVLY